MKFLLLLAVVAFAFWLLKTKTRAAPPPARKPPPPAPEPAAMLECVHCGLHLPQTETVQDASGRIYCSAAHRLAGPR
jgi:uncharacterized protein